MNSFTIYALALSFVVLFTESAGETGSGSGPGSETDSGSESFIGTGPDNGSGDNDVPESVECSGEGLRDGGSGTGSGDGRQDDGEQYDL
jgi:hypothetical protein